MAKRRLNSKEDADHDHEPMEAATNKFESHGATIGSKKRQKRDIVSLTNALSYADFLSTYVPTELLRFPLEPQAIPLSDVNNHNTILHLGFATGLRDSIIHACFDLIQSTSRLDYEASGFGWNAKKKLKEMKQPEMRYLIATHQPPTNSDRIRNSPVSEDFVGFLSFMVTHEDGLPVLYIYEIHLAANARGRGLGNHLMHAATEIANKIAGLKKVMLTCFVSNTSAVEFYRRLGFETDENSPADRKTRGKLVKADYIIMSKLVVSSSNERQRAVA